MKITYRVVQVALVVSVAGLTLLIFLRGRQDAATVTKEENNLEKRMGKPPQRGSNTSMNGAASDFSFQAYRKQQLAALPDTAQKQHQALPESTKEKDTSAIHQFVKFWKAQSKPLLAGVYQARLARQSSLPGAWTRAGKFFQKAHKQTKDSTAKAYAVSKALNAFQTALNAKPNDLEAKAGLALTYIEGKQRVMKGVQLLKDVVEKNPRHEKALFYLGMLSIRSGQYEKALQRFKKLVEIKPQNPFNHLYLGNVQEQLGNKSAALQEYKKYRKLVKQPSLKANATEKINALKSSQKN